MKKEAIMSTRKKAKKIDPRAWARDWFSGGAYCPGCGKDESMSTLGNDSCGDGVGYVETWSCGRCNRTWKIELREAAALADAEDDDVKNWIERYGEPVDNEVLEAATICAELFTGNGARTRLPQWARREDGEPLFDEIAKRARAALAKLAGPQL